MLLFDCLSTTKKIGNACLLFAHWIYVYLTRAANRTQGRVSALIGGVRVPTSVGFFALSKKSPTEVGTLTPLPIRSTKVRETQFSLIASKSMHLVFPCRILASCFHI